MLQATYSIAGLHSKERGPAPVERLAVLPSGGGGRGGGLGETLHGPLRMQGGMSRVRGVTAELEAARGPGSVAGAAADDRCALRSLRRCPRTAASGPRCRTMVPEIPPLQVTRRSPSKGNGDHSSSVPCMIAWSAAELAVLRVLIADTFLRHSVSIQSSKIALIPLWFRFDRKGMPSNGAQQGLL